jgi:hypothetical protein
MGLIAPLAALLGLETEALLAKAKSAILAYALIGLFLLAAVIFLIAAGYMAVAEELGPILAALLFGGVFLVLALAVYLGTLIGRSRRQRQVAEKRRASESGAFLTTAAITALPLLTKSPMLLRLGLPAAAIAAIALMRNNSKHD